MDMEDEGKILKHVCGYWPLLEANSLYSDIKGHSERGQTSEQRTNQKFSSPSLQPLYKGQSAGSQACKHVHYSEVPLHMLILIHTALYVYVHACCFQT